MPLGGTGQRAAGQHADGDDADAGRFGVIEQPSVILRRIVRRQRHGGRRIEHVVNHLRTVEDAGVDHLMQRRSVANRGEPEKANFPLGPQPLECRDHLAKHLPDAQRFAAAVLGDCVVQMEDIDPVATQSREAIFERLCHCVRDAAEIGARQADLGADNRVGGFQLLQNAAEVLFRLAVAVLHRRVEVIHADLERAGDGAFLIARIAAHHQPADRAAAEAQHRNLHAGAAVWRAFPSCFSRSAQIT